MALSRFPGASKPRGVTGRTSRQVRRKPPTLKLALETLEQRLVLSDTSMITAAGTGAQALSQINHFVVIYQENWSFDGLYGNFPGANGIANATDASGKLLPQYQQVDKNGNPITTLPNPSTDPKVPGGLPAQPYDLSQYVSPSDKTGDIVHRFYTEQLQIGNGALQPGTGNNNKFVTWSDNKNLVLSYFDASNLPEGKLAQQYTMDDNFFHAAYGGSFLNHQFLVAADAPQWNQTIPANFQSSFDPATQALKDANLTTDGKYVVNTTFSTNLVPNFSTPGAPTLLKSINDSNPSDPTRPFEANIGDRLSGAGVGWKWYSGGWDAAVNLQKAYQSGDATQIAAAKAPFNDSTNPLSLFQWHHQPFAYFDNYAPLSTGGQAHLQDETRFLTDVSSGNLPGVSFVKPLGPDNEHPGYASLAQGQQHVADLVHAIQAGPDWQHTAIIITYDENGGRWDHVSPPKANEGWGDGTRVPAIVISPLAKQGFVDHTQHDTLSILKTIENRFGLPSLNSRDAAASDLANDFAMPAQPQAATGPDQHVLMLSVDGLHQADVTDPNLAPDLTNILKLKSGGVSYTNASTSKPSDSFPGTLSYLTGAGPATTGVYYDDAYSRTLFAPGTTDTSKAKPGTEVQYAENIDKNPSLLSGGGNFDATSIDPTKLPLDAQGKPVYPNQVLKVNTTFDVAHQAGLYTAFSDKHPAYQIANGNDPNAIDNLYAPEVNSTTALLDPTTGKTVDANALLAADPFTDVSKYILVDAGTDPMGANDPNLINNTTHNLLLTEKYDDLKVQAILNEIRGLTAQGTYAAPVPNLFGMNFQAVSVAEKYAFGGINLLPNGDTTPSPILEAAIRHTDASIGKIAAALQNTKDATTGGSLLDTTEVIVTAKHGQAPRVGIGGLMKDSTLPDLLTAAGAPVAQATQDDVSLIWLQNQADTAKAVNALNAFVNPNNHNTIDVYFQGTKTTLPAGKVIDKILSGSALVNAGFSNPTTDSTTPDIIVTLKPGYIWVGNPITKFTFKRAEHGGFSADDTHVPLIVAGGALSKNLRGTSVDTPVTTTQIAVTALNSLGLSAAQLQGAVIEGTKGLPGLGLPQDNTFQLTEGQTDQALVGAFQVPNATGSLKGYKVVVDFGDGTATDQHPILVRDAINPRIVLVYAVHSYDEQGVHHGTLTVTGPDKQTTTTTFTATVLDVLTANGELLDVKANEAFNLKTVATLTDLDASAVKGDFTARIDWGDGYQSNGIVQGTGSDGKFNVQGSHTYVGHTDATYGIKVTITDSLGSRIEADGKARVTFTSPTPTGSGTTPAPNPPGTPAGPQGIPRDPSPADSATSSGGTPAVDPPNTPAGTQGNGTSITPQGWFVSPAGTQTQLGDRPFGVALSPDGKTLAVTNDGAGTQSIMVVDRAGSKIIDEIDYSGDDPRGPQGVYVGIAYSPDGTKLYASAGGTFFDQNGVPSKTGTYNGVRVYDVDPATGKLTETAPVLIPMTVGTNGSHINLFTAGLALSADGNTLYVADNLGSALSAIDLTSDAATTGRATTTIPVGPNPYTVILSRDGKTAYVSNQGGLTVSVIDLTRPVFSESDRVQVGTHPNAMAMNPAKDELYVANADSDTISVIDTLNNVVVRTIDLTPYLGSKEGSSPDALTVSPDGTTLYVANALNNDVAVIKLGSTQGGDKVQGLIPTAWYPTALTLSNDGKELDVLNAKGLGAGPNEGGPNPYGPNTYGPPNQYIGSMIVGTLSQIQVPDAATLATDTNQVTANNGFNEGDKVRTAGAPQSHVIPLRPGDSTPIKHVIYVVKENRTYDQVLGSLGKGNGDPDLNLFGDESAPNARALAKQFVTLDNFYSDAEVSADGWNWVTGALANSYVQHAWPQNYGGQHRPYDFEGGNLATSPGTDPTDAFIWNKLSDASVNYRNYGFRVFGGAVASTEPRLAANTDLNYAGFDMRKPDSVPDLIQTGVNQPTRIDEWLKEFNKYEANSTLPTVEFVRLPNDHTATDTPGAPTPRAYVADNDQALGKLVDAVSHSKDWGSTAIFVIEDDAQEGPDHVDAHRTVAQVISPYTQTGKVDSTFYSQVSVLRTIEQVVGIAPMTQFDASATPMLNSFTDTPNMTTYSAITPTQNVHEKNPVAAPHFSLYSSLAAAATAVDQNESLENKGIWASIKGADSTMPAPVSNLHLGGAKLPGTSTNGSLPDPGNQDN